MLHFQGIHIYEMLPRLFILGFLHEIYTANIMETIETITNLESSGYHSIRQVDILSSNRFRANPTSDVDCLHRGSLKDCDFFSPTQCNTKNVLPEPKLNTPGFPQFSFSGAFDITFFNITMTFDLWSSSPFFIIPFLTPPIL
jgi:hypothetical protein